GAVTDVDLTRQVTEEDQPRLRSGAVILPASGRGQAAVRALESWFAARFTRLPTAGPGEFRFKVTEEIAAELHFNDRQSRVGLEIGTPLIPSDLKASVHRTGRDAAVHRRATEIARVLERKAEVPPQMTLVPCEGAKKTVAVVAESMGQEPAGLVLYDRPEERSTFTTGDGRPGAVTRLPMTAGTKIVGTVDRLSVTVEGDLVTSVFRPCA
ncbi:hypothetical protein ACFQ07_30465, partial [Actinomadura adrarensis]